MRKTIVWISALTTAAVLVGFLSKHWTSYSHKERTIAPMRPGEFVQAVPLKCSLGDEEDLDADNSAIGSTHRVVVQDSTHDSRTPCVVVVADSRGAHLSHAAVWKTGSPPRRLGMTDDAGRLEVSRALIEGQALIVCHRRYQMRRVVIDNPCRSPIVVQLDEGARLVGQVKWTGSEDVPSSARVLAWPDGYLPTEPQVSGSLLDGVAPDLRIVDCDSEGRFVFEGLDRARSLSLTAAAEGGLQIDPTLGCRPNAVPLDLYVTPCYSAVLRLHPSNQTALALSANLYGNGPSWEALADHVDTLGSVPLGFYSLVDERDWHFASINPRDHLILLSSERKIPEGVEVEFQVQAVGCDSIWTRFFVPPIASRLAPLQVDVPCSDVLRGSLEVVYVSDMADVGAVAVLDSVAGILFLDGGGTCSMGSPVRQLNAHSIIVEGIPFGEYRASFRSRVFPVRLPSDTDFWKVRIGPERARIEIDLSGLGTAQVIVLESDGTEYAGRITFHVENLDSRMSSFTTFEHAPYFLQGLPLGNYNIRIDELPGLDDSHKEFSFVSVDRGTLSTTAIQIGR